MSGILSWTRDKSLRFFYHFGIHCATHQIRLILISGLVITSLFYPALGIYSSSLPTGLFRFPGPALNDIFSPTVRSLSFFEDDLVNVWSGHAILRTTEDPVVRARCGMEKTIRVERVLITSNNLNFDTGAINLQTLLSTSEFERRLAQRIFSDRLDCLASPTGGCFRLSPLQIWGDEEQALALDSNLISTVNRDRNFTVAGLSLKPSMVFAGRDSADPHGSSIDFSAFIALTYFFNEDDCNGSNGHNAWIKAVQDISTSVGDFTPNSQEPTFLALELNAETKKLPRVSLITVTLYLSYIIFFVYFSGSMRRMDTVHSRIGLCFTGLVEILVSTITSLSVCAIGGLRITLVPWGIFPIVIVFVGAENMFRLIDEVVKTKISLPVKERIGLGLSRAGTSNTAKVVSYNAILGVIAFFAHGAIRQFCVFAIVVLVAHWFLIHTFFVAVLSIDIQRLELGDLLRQDSAIGSSGSRRANGSEPAAKSTPLAKTIGDLRKVTNGRLTRNVSLLLLLVITATLYYSTLPNRTQPKEERISRASVRRTKAEQSILESHSSAHNVWKILNPQNDPLVHLRIEAPSIITLDLKHDDTHIDHHKGHRARWFARTYRFVVWICKVLILPIGVTLSGLYALLLYLLKGTDKLEERYEREEADFEPQPKPIEGQASFGTLPLVFPTDVTHLAPNSDGSVVVSVSADGEAFVWLASSRTFHRLETDDLTLRSMSMSSSECPFTAAAVDENGSIFAISTDSGVIGLWSVRPCGLAPLSSLSVCGCTLPITQIALYCFRGSVSSASENTDSTAKVSEGTICTFAVYDNTRIVRWLGDVPTDYRPTHGDATLAMLTIVRDITYPLCSFSFADGGLEITDPYCGVLPKGTIYIQAGTPEDNVVLVHVRMVKVEDAERALIAAATSSGMVTLWDGNTGELVHTMDGAYGTVSDIQILPMAPKACSQCGETPLCSFTLAYSVGHIVSLDHGVLTRRCSCPIAQLVVSKLVSTKDSPLGRRSRNGSFVSSSGMEMSVRARSRHASVSNEAGAADISSFPVSAHGMHSRRGSERDLRRTSDMHDKLSLQSFEDSFDADEQPGLSVRDASRRAPDNNCSSALSYWRNFRLVRLREETCERGGWGLLGNKVVGLRRRPRSRQSHGKGPTRPSDSNTGLHSLLPSVLDRWEVWIFDPSAPEGPLRASSLSELKVRDKAGLAQVGATAGKSVSRLAFTRLFPIVVKDALVIAGFGNSVGVIDFGL